MGRMSRPWIVCALAPLALAAALAGAPAARSEPALAEAARDYRASLADLLPFREAAVTRARETLVNRRDLAERGLIARRDAEAAAQALAAAEAALAATQTEIDQAERMIAEASVPPLPPGKPGALIVTPALVRFQGARDWSLAQVPSVERFFIERFHRALPVSALGQTPAHDRLGFDHRNAVDVAVHPDSPEGQALMAWLRGRGVSFLAFRGAVAGEATGAHVHIGEPSARQARHRAG
jgi:multidrug efflux pump subunit AcrA (membrane-fusion protein)